MVDGFGGAVLPAKCVEDSNYIIMHIYIRIYYRYAIYTIYIYIYLFIYLFICIYSVCLCKESSTHVETDGEAEGLILANLAREA